MRTSRTQSGSRRSFERRASKSPVPINQPTVGRTGPRKTMRDQLALSDHDRNSNSPGVSSPSKHSMPPGPSQDPRRNTQVPDNLNIPASLIEDIVAAVTARLQQTMPPTPTPPSPQMYSPRHPPGPDTAIQLQLNALKDDVDGLNPQPQAAPLGVGMLPFTRALRTAIVPTHFEMPRF